MFYTNEQFESKAISPMNHRTSIPELLNIFSSSNNFIKIIQMKNNKINFWLWMQVQYFQNPIYPFCHQTFQFRRKIHDRLKKRNRHALAPELERSHRNLYEFSLFLGFPSFKESNVLIANKIYITDWLKFTNKTWVTIEVQYIVRQH